MREPCLLPVRERTAVRRLRLGLADSDRRRAALRLERRDLADGMYAALFPLAQDAERIIQTTMTLMRLGAADSQLDRLRREAVRERKAADALLLGGRLRRVRAERTVERLDERLFARPIGPNLH